jgi:hypothetical protein
MSAKKVSWIHAPFISWMIARAQRAARVRCDVFRVDA